MAQAQSAACEWNAPTAQPHAVAAALAPRLPRFAPGALDLPRVDAALKAVSEREALTSAAEWWKGQREAMRDFIELALHAGWCDEAEVEAALDAPDTDRAMIELYKSLTEAVGAGMAAHAERYAPDSEVPLWYGLTLADGEEDSSLVLFGDIGESSLFCLDHLPERLRDAVRVTLSRLSRTLLPAMTSDDLHYGFFCEESLESFKTLMENVDLEDREAVAAHIRAEDLDSEFGWDVSTDEAFAEWREHWLKTHAAAEDAERLEKHWPDENKLCAEALLREVWSWRRENPELYRSPWRRFVFTAACSIRRYAEQLEVLASALSREESEYYDYEGEVPLSNGLMLLTGRPWDEEQYHALNEGLMGAGEQPSLRLPLRHEGFSSIQGKLEAIAEGHALYRLALAINAEEESDARDRSDT